MIDSSFVDWHIRKTVGADTFVDTVSVDGRL